MTGQDAGRRGSTGHGPRVDDALARESDALTRGGAQDPRADERREYESPAEGEPTPDRRVQGDRDLTPEGQMTPDDTEERADIARRLRLSAFPADRDALLRVADEEGAPDDVLERLRSLPDGRTFENVQEVWVALGGETEDRT